MAIILTILKVLGILLLVLLALVLVIALAVLFVPFKYRANGGVEDPDGNEELKLTILKKQLNLGASVTWLFGAVKVLFSYHGKEMLEVRIFGVDIGIMDKLQKIAAGRKKGEKEKKEEEDGNEEISVIEKAAELIGKGLRVLDVVDSIRTTLFDGKCGRRAWNKVTTRIFHIIAKMQPGYFRVGGTVGLSDPVLNGAMTGAGSMLMPFVGNQLQVNTDWDKYRFDMKAEVSGQVQLIVPVKETVPLIFDKDCKKVFKKIMKEINKIR